MRFEEKYFRLIFISPFSFIKESVVFVNAAVVGLDPGKHFYEKGKATLLQKNRIP
jgi:hypothetical protein